MTDNRQVHGFRAVAVHAIELVLVVAVACGMLLYATASVQVLGALDWGSSVTFEELVQRVLFLLIGVELIQIIWAHHVRDVFLVSVFLLARKALDPANTTPELIALALSAVAVVGVWHLLVKKTGLGLNEPL